MQLSLPRFGLSTLFLVLTVVCVAIVQIQMGWKEQRRWERFWESYEKQATHPPLGDGPILPPPVVETSKWLGVTNFIIVVLAIRLHRRYGRRAAWCAVIAALVTTSVAVVVSKLVNGF